MFLFFFFFSFLSFFFLLFLFLLSFLLQVGGVVLLGGEHVAELEGRDVGAELVGGDVLQSLRSRGVDLTADTTSPSE